VLEIEAVGSVTVPVTLIPPEEIVRSLENVEVAPVSEPPIVKAPVVEAEVNAPVEGVVAPMGVASIEPALMVRLLATSLSAHVKPRIPELVSSSLVMVEPSFVTVVESRASARVPVIVEESRAIVNPVPVVPEVRVPSVVMFVDPAHVESAVFSTLPRPKLVLAFEAVVAPVPPCVTAKGVDRVRAPVIDTFPVMFAPPPLMVRSLEKVEVAKVEVPLEFKLPVRVRVVPVKVVFVSLRKN